MRNSSCWCLPSSAVVVVVMDLTSIVVATATVAAGEAEMHSRVLQARWTSVGVADHEATRENSDVKEVDGPTVGIEGKDEAECDDGGDGVGDADEEKVEKSGEQREARERGESGVEGVGG
jgi:hypothetical protein